MKNTLSLMTVCSMLLALMARGQVASADNSKTSPADSGDVTAGLTASASQPASNSPVITRVSPIVPRRNQTIVIEGSGFGNSPPKLVPAGDAVDTDARNGRRPTLAVRNHGRGADDWQAGLASDGGANALGIKLVNLDRHQDYPCRIRRRFGRRGQNAAPGKLPPATPLRSQCSGQRARNRPNLQRL